MQASEKQKTDSLIRSLKEELEREKARYSELKHKYKDLKEANRQIGGGAFKVDGQKESAVV